jgi:hypothetical protein
LLKLPLKKTNKKNKYALGGYTKSQVAAAYGLRRLKPYATRAIRVRDDTNAETDIGFVGQNLDVSGLTTWLRRNLVASVPLGTDGNADGVSDGWVHSNQAGITSTPTIEDSSQKIAITVSTSTNAASVYKQFIACAVGANVSITSTLKTSGNVKARLQIDWYNGAAYLSSTSGTLTAYANYTVVTLNGTAPASTTQFGVLIRVNPNSIGDTGSLWANTCTVTISNQSAYITKWYDQSGNGNDAIQATAANQPRIVNAGAVDVDASGRPTCVFDGSNDVLSIVNSASVDITSAPMMINSVFNPLSQDGYIVSKNVDTAITIQYAALYQTSNTRINSYLEGAVAQSSANASFNASTQKIYSFEFLLGNQRAYSNGNSSGTAGTYNSTLTSRANMQIGARSNNAGGTAFATFYKGTISELIILRSITNRNKLERNQGKYYGIAVS